MKLQIITSIILSVFGGILKMPGCTVIICEFNPLHAGHRHILSRAAEYGLPVIAVMSGNLTQRSECAVYDKYRRAAAAVACGADAVVELPFPWSSAGAEFFARGGVSLGAALGAERFVFGSETGDADYVRRAANCAQSEEYRRYLADITDPALGAAASTSAAMEHFGYDLGPNDRLGTYYMSAAQRVAPEAEFCAVRRMTDCEIWRSATELRRVIDEGGTAAALPYIPTAAAAFYGEQSDAVPDALAGIEYLYFRLFACGGERAFEAQGGVAERLCRAAHECGAADGFFAAAATKKYTDSRLRRAALFSILDVGRGALEDDVHVTVLLAANARGREYLAAIRHSDEITILTKPSASGGLDSRSAAQYRLLCRADELYAACMRGGVPAGEFLRRTPAML